MFKIQLNTDKNISGDERLESYLSALIEDKLSNFRDDITRIEVHLAEENAGDRGDKTNGVCLRPALKIDNRLRLPAMRIQWRKL